MIAIVDYGAGNLKSVKNALNYLDVPSFIASEPQQIIKAEGVILPGVGAFGDAAGQLDRSGLKQAVRTYILEDRPFLGICVGMQLLFLHSDESPGAQGLNVFDGKIRRFDDSRYKVPHIGWNSLEITQPENKLFDGVKTGEFVYFVHSYYIKTSKGSEVAGKCGYAAHFDCAVNRGNIYGLQFHPEKSGETGLRILKNFCALTEEFREK